MPSPLQNQHSAGRASKVTGAPGGLHRTAPGGLLRTGWWRKTHQGSSFSTQEMTTVQMDRHVLYIFLGILQTDIYCIYNTYTYINNTYTHISHIYGIHIHIYNTHIYVYIYINMYAYTLYTHVYIYIYIYIYLHSVIMITVFVFTI